MRIRALLSDAVMERKMFRAARNTYRPSSDPEDLE